MAKLGHMFTGPKSPDQSASQEESFDMANVVAFNQESRQKFEKEHPDLKDSKEAMLYLEREGEITELAIRVATQISER